MFETSKVTVIQWTDYAAMTPPVATIQDDRSWMYSARVTQQDCDKINAGIKEDMAAVRVNWNSQDSINSLRTTLAWYKLQAERYERSLKAIKRLAYNVPQGALGKIRHEADSALGPGADSETPERAVLHAIRGIAFDGFRDAKQVHHRKAVEFFESILSKIEESLS